MSKSALAVTLMVIYAILSGGCAKETVNEEITEPVAVFDIKNEIHPAPCEVSFVNHSTGNSENCRWDFGDGTISQDDHPEHVYSAGGTYAVRLTVTNKLGSEAVTYKTLTIPEKPTRMKITGIELISVPDQDPNGSAWDPEDGPDVFFYILDENSIPITMTSCLNNIDNNSLPILVDSGLPLEFSQFTETIKIAAYDRDTGAGDPDDYLGGRSIHLSEVIPEYGAPYPLSLNFSGSSNPLRFNVKLEWE